MSFFARFQCPKGRVSIIATWSRGEIETFPLVLLHSNIKLPLSHNDLVGGRVRFCFLFCWFSIKDIVSSMRDSMSTCSLRDSKFRICWLWEWREKPLAFTMAFCPEKDFNPYFLVQPIQIQRINHLLMSRKSTDPYQLWYLACSVFSLVSWTEAKARCLFRMLMETLFQIPNMQREKSSVLVTIRKHLACEWLYHLT